MQREGVFIKKFLDGTNPQNGKKISPNLTKFEDEFGVVINKFEINFFIFFLTSGIYDIITISLLFKEALLFRIFCCFFSYKKLFYFL